MHIWSHPLFSISLCSYGPVSGVPRRSRAACISFALMEAPFLLSGLLAPAASGDSLDWKDYDAAAITKRVTSRVAPGSIVLFHNAALHTPEALPGILEYLLQNGYEAVPVSCLLLPGQYGTDFTIDHTGRQCPAS